MNQYFSCLSFVVLVDALDKAIAEPNIWLASAYEDASLGWAWDTSNEENQ